MKLILFIHKNSSQNGLNLKKAIDCKFKEIENQTLMTFNSLKARLKQFVSFNDKEIFILLADSQDHLNELTSLIDLMEDKRIVLVLPDESKKSLSMATKFFPRFFTDMNSNYNDLCDVLKKMVQPKVIN
jgi:hypothetical protein